MLLETLDPERAGFLCPSKIPVVCLPVFFALLPEFPKLPRQSPQVINGNLTSGNFMFFFAKRVYVPPLLQWCNCSESGDLVTWIQAQIVISGNFTSQIWMKFNIIQ